MRPSGGDMPRDERLARLERKAEIIRDRLIQAVDTLEERRHRAVEVGQRAKQMAKPVALSLAAALALLGLGFLAIHSAVRARRSGALSHRLSQTFQRFDLVRRPSLGKRFVESITLSLLTFLGTELAKRMSRNVVKGYVLAPRGETP